MSFGDWGFDEVTRLATALTAGVLWSVCFGHARAQDPAAACAPELTENRHAFIDHDGAHGLWFADPVARCLIAGFGTLRLVKEELTLTNAQLRLRSDQLTRYQQALDDAVALEITSRKALAEARASADPGFFDSPILWGAVGFVAGALVVILTTFAVQGG